jgi:hypothetical protein
VVGTGPPVCGCGFAALSPSFRIFFDPAVRSTSLDLFSTSLDLAHCCSMPLDSHFETSRSLDETLSMKGENGDVA